MSRFRTKGRTASVEREDESYCAWFPERMLEMISKGQGKEQDNWAEKGLPKLVKKIEEGYRRDGVMERLDGKDLPSKDVVIGALEDLLTIVFPDYQGKGEITASNVKYSLGSALSSVHSRLVGEVEKTLRYVCRRVKECPEDACRKRALVVVKGLLEKIPEVRELSRGDIQAAYDGDPAAQSTDEIVLSYPCVFAIETYRIAHELYLRGVPLIPRIMSEYAHSKTGIDIHPGARIGRDFFIDHGTGVVIGETTEIGDNVKIYQGVTLGALSFPKDERGRVLKGRKRHPTVGNNVVIYSGATILGPEAVVGDNAVIGGNAWITTPVPAGTKVTVAPPASAIKSLSR